MIKSKEITEGCLSRIPDDEPIFVLRGKDKLAPHVIRAWAMLAELAGAPPGKISEARECARYIELWQGQRGSKVPD